MKKMILSTGLVLGLALSAPAALFTWSSGTLNTAIPDNAPGVTFGTSGGTWSSTVPSGYTFNSVDVNLNISGTYNGDLYGYLVYSVGVNSHTTILLNRVGRTGAGDAGYGTDGMNVILTGQSGYSDIHGVASPDNGGTYLADARTVSPLGDFSSVSRDTSAGLEWFNDNNSGWAANGTWLLFLSDVAAGDQSTLVSWGLQIDAVPEPITWALIVFGGVLGTLKLGHYWRTRRKTAIAPNE